MNKEQLITLTKEFIHEATHYNMDYLDRIYSKDLTIVMVDENDQVSTMDKDQTLGYFKERLDSGAPPLSEESDFLYAGGDEKLAMVLVSRTMQFNARLEKMLFTLFWQKTDIGWQVVKESSSITPA
jgi:hypothetical protein